MRILPIVALVAVVSLAQANPERAIGAFVDAHIDEAVALLERVVNINSGTQNLAGVRAVGNVFRAEFDALGFKTAWIDGASWHRAGHLVAVHPGTGPKVVLIGHLDTVFERDSPFQKFQKTSDREAHGPGVVDMKGGDVIIVQALKALAAANILPSMNMTVVMTGDEEDPGRPLSQARAALVAAAKGADAAIGFENGPGDPRFAVAARRGATRWDLRVTGVPAHSSQIFRAEIGAGAVFEAARILDGFRAKMAGEPHLTFNAGVVLGGTTVDLDDAQLRGSAFGKTNVVAEHARIVGDLRTLSRDQLDRAEQTMQQIVAASLPRTTASIAFDAGYPPLAETEGNLRLLAMYDRASRDLGFGPVRGSDPDDAGAADVSFVAGEAKMILDGVGLMGRDAHIASETADLTTLPSQTKRAAVLLYRLATR
jgi:glutamate carboxypeptidase